MFFDEDRILAVREMILADDEKARRAALAKLLPMQRDDFVELFEIMDGLPVTIRLLDPPLHEFLPHTDEEIAEVAAGAWAPIRRSSRDRARELHEFNPMLGFRGCRLAIAYPEIAEMQARAIFEAAVEVGRATGAPVVPEIMVPLVASKAELDLVKARIDAMAETVVAETRRKVDYQVGTMIELPRAALQGRRDRRDRRVLLLRHQRPDPDHLRHQPRRCGELPGHLHVEGHLAGRPVRVARPRGRRRTRCASPPSAAASARPDLKLGICGEHGGDPASIAFCDEVGLDYVSCSPFRVPIARLAAAQAALAKRTASLE